MKLDITKACADSLRAFTQNNYGIQLKSSHAHELVAAYFGYSSRAALLAEKQCPIVNLTDADIIILNPPTLFELFWMGGLAVNTKIYLTLSSTLFTTEVITIQMVVYHPKKGKDK